MNIDRLREFIVLSKTPSFHSAAKKLNVAPSTLSRHIAEMEHELGVILMVRKSTSIKLTHAGYVFLEGICNVVNLYDEVVEKTTEASSVSRYPIIVGGYFVMDGIMKLYNAAVAMAVVEKCPIKPIVYEPHTSSSYERLKRHDPEAVLRNGTADMLIEYQTNRSDRDESFIFETIYRDPFMVMLHNEHPLAQRGEPVTLEELRGLELVQNDFFAESGQYILSVFENAGVSVRPGTYVFDSAGDQFYARNVDSMHIISASNVPSLAPSSITGLVALPIADDTAYYDAVAVWKDDNENPGIEMFIDVLKRAASQMYGE